MRTAIRHLSGAPDRMVVVSCILIASALLLVGA